jgi:hypothetical protein
MVTILYVQCLIETRRGKTRQDKTSEDKTRPNEARQDKTEQEKTRQDKTKQDKTRQESPFFLISDLVFVSAGRLGRIFYLDSLQRLGLRVRVILFRDEGQS